MPKSVKDEPPSGDDPSKGSWVRERRASVPDAEGEHQAADRDGAQLQGNAETATMTSLDAGSGGSDGDERPSQPAARRRTLSEPPAKPPSHRPGPPDAPASPRSGRRTLSEPPAKPPSYRPAPPDAGSKPTSYHPPANEAAPDGARASSVPPGEDDRHSAEALLLLRPRSSPHSSPEPLEPAPLVHVVDEAPESVPPTSSPNSIRGAHEIEPGKTVDGRYRIEELLGAGAVGLVYRCRHLVLDKTLAIKVLRPDFARDAEVSERLVVEAKAASAIGSPHIVETVDFGRLADGSAFFVMEYLEGFPLTDLVESPDPLPPGELLHIAIQLAAGLGEAHAAGIVHRDLKPDNVFVVKRGDDDRFVKILDFGIAKLARAERKLTRAGQVYGTPHYMSPEQAAGKATDQRTDVYAVGIILFELLTGAVPFDAEEPMAILIQHVQDAPPDLDANKKPGTELVPGMDRVVGKCLAKAAEDRYQNMAELAADLERLQGGLAPQAIVAPQRSLAPGASDPSRHSTPRGAYAVAALGVIVSAALGYALYTKTDVIQVVQTVEAPSNALPSVPAPVTSAPPTAPAEAESTGRDVMVIVFPADARISRGRDDLGKMPVTVNVPDGETVTLSIRHPGFASRRLKVDGKRSRIVVGLVRLKKGKKHTASAEAEAAAEAAADKAAARMAAAEMPRSGSGAGAKPSAPTSPETPTDEGAAEAPSEPAGAQPAAGETAGAASGAPASEPPAAQPPSAPADDTPAAPSPPAE